MMSVTIITIKSDEDGNGDIKHGNMAFQQKLPSPSTNI